MSKREYIVKETNKYVTYRIFKRLLKHPHKQEIRNFLIVNLTVAKNGKWFSFASFNKNGLKKRRTFYCKNGTLINAGDRNYTVDFLCNIDNIFKIGTRARFSKYTQQKTNRVLKNIFPEIKVKDNTIQFLTDYMFKSPAFEQIKDLSDAPSYYPSRYVLYGLSKLRKQLKKSQNIKDFLRRSIGVSGKKTVKLFCNDLMQVSNIAQLSKIKKYISHGVVNDVLSRRYYIAEDISIIKKILKLKPDLAGDLLQPKNRHYLLHICQLIKSLDRTLYTITIEDLQGNTKKIHDNLSYILTKQRTKNVEYEDWFKPIETNDMLIRCPKDKHEVIEWGSEMKHCIAGFTESHMRGSMIVCGVFENNELKWNLSMRPSNDGYLITQFLGKINKEPPKEFLVKTVAIMQKRGIVSKKQQLSTIWGYK